MRKTRGVFLIVCLMGFVISLYPGNKTNPIHPKLDCHKMALDFVKALENRDFRSFIQLTSVESEYSEEHEANFRKELDSPEAKEKLPLMLEMIRLFPEIGEVPEWVTGVTLTYGYIQGDNLIEVEGEFILTGETWIIETLEPREWEKLDEEEKKKFAGKISPVPPDGQKIFDAGLNELMAELISAIKEKSWDGAKKTGVHPDGCGLHPDDPPEEREKALGRLTQIPSIGAIPAPATRLCLSLEGTLDDKDAEAEIEFHWPDNKLEILHLSFK